MGVTEGALQQVKASINAHQVGNEADLGRLGQRKDKAVRDLATGAEVPGHDAASGADRRHRQRAAELPLAGHVRRSRTPPFKEGDNAWTGAEIAEIPDLSQMYIDLKLEEVDRGKLQIGQTREDPGGRDSGQGIHRRAGLHQPDRGAGFQGRLDARRRLSRRAPR